jgi:hypothetical protein
MIQHGEQYAAEEAPKLNNSLKSMGLMEHG